MIPYAERKPNYPPRAYPTQNGFSFSNPPKEEEKKIDSKEHELAAYLIANKGDGNIVSGSDQLRRATRGESEKKSRELVTSFPRF